MSFIRAKEIPPGSGNWYDYEVRSVWNHGNVRQEIIRYIGKSTSHLSRSGLSGGGLQAVDVTPASTLPIADEVKEKR